MDEAPRIYPNLSDETQFRSNKINEIKDYFIAEIRERETMSKKLSKYKECYMGSSGANEVWLFQIFNQLKTLNYH